MMALPDYRVRVSKRAKYIALRVLASGVVEVRLPVGVPEHEAERLVRKHQKDIEQTLQEIRQRPKMKPKAMELPEYLDFPCIQQRIAIQTNAGADNTWQWDEGVLHVTHQQTAYIPAIVRDYIKHKAKHALPPILAQYAEEMQESYKSVRIKWQKTRWGSCSAQRCINLNAKLLLLPTPLVRHVMVHELAHLQHLNHSSEFWQHVACFDDDYQRLRQDLRTWERDMPRWLHVD